MLHRHIYTCRGFCDIIYNADGVESVTVISVHRKPGNFPVGEIEKLVNGWKKNTGNGSAKYANDWWLEISCYAFSFVDMKKYVHYL